MDSVWNPDQSQRWIKQLCYRSSLLDRVQLPTRSYCTAEACTRRLWAIIVSHRHTALNAQPLCTSSFKAGWRKCNPAASSLVQSTAAKLSATSSQAALRDKNLWKLSECMASAPSSTPQEQEDASVAPAAHKLQLVCKSWLTRFSRRSSTSCLSLIQISWKETGCTQMSLVSRILRYELCQLKARVWQRAQIFKCDNSARAILPAP